MVVKILCSQDYFIAYDFFYDEIEAIMLFALKLTLTGIDNFIQNPGKCPSKAWSVWIADKGTEIKLLDLEGSGILVINALDWLKGFLSPRSSSPG